MKFVLITGPQAVGKMTVGQELVKITTLITMKRFSIKLQMKLYMKYRLNCQKIDIEVN